MFDPLQRFQCLRCGNCCGRHLKEWWLEILPSEVQVLREIGSASAIRKVNGKYFLKRKEDGSCVFLREDNLCNLRTEYEWYPLSCKLFPLGIRVINSTLIIFLNEAFAKKVGCKGLGKGETLGAQIDEVLDALRKAGIIEEYYVQLK